MAEYRIDELARRAGTTTRNVRAYQSRNLLPPPQLRGRLGVYDDAHLARLRLIGSLLARGYATPQISELLASWEQGKDLADVLGLEEVITSPWTDETPTSLPAAEVHALLTEHDSPARGGSEPDDPGAADPGAADPGAGEPLLERLERQGLLRRDGDQVVLPSPRLLNAFVELLGYGFSARQIIDLYEGVVPAVDTVARRMVEAGAARFIDSYGDNWLPRADEVAEITTVLQRLRQLAVSSMQALFAQAMERTVEDVFGQRLTQLLAEPDDPSVPADQKAARRGDDPGAGLDGDQSRR